MGYKLDSEQLRNQPERQKLEAESNSIQHHLFDELTVLPQFHDKQLLLWQIDGKPSAAIRFLIRFRLFTITQVPAERSGQN